MKVSSLLLPFATADLISFNNYFNHMKNHVYKRIDIQNVPKVEEQILMFLLKNRNLPVRTGNHKVNNRMANFLRNHRN